MREDTMSMGARGNGGHVHLLELLLVAPSATKGGSSSHITVRCCVHSTTNPGSSVALFYHMSQFVIQISVASRIVHRSGPPIPCTRQLRPQQALVLLTHDGRPPNGGLRQESLRNAAACCAVRHSMPLAAAAVVHSSFVTRRGSTRAVCKRFTAAVRGAGKSG